MKKILIASHGKTASGIVSTISMFLSTAELCYVDAYVDDPTGNYDHEITDFLNLLSEEDDAYIFTDIYGGSVNQRIIDLVLREGKDKKIKIITNCNVPIVIELLMRENELSDEEIDSIIENCKPVLIIPNHIQIDEEISDDEFFG